MNATRLKLFFFSLLIALPPSAFANNPNAASGKQVAERLQRGVDNPEQENNISRRGEAVTSDDQVKDNMRKIFRKLLVTEVGGEVDKAYNPHLRDALFEPKPRSDMANARMRAGAVGFTSWPIPSAALPSPYCLECFNAFGSQTACDICNYFRCPWVRPWFDHHLHWECCPYFGSVDTSIYGRFTEDTNFKACCVRNDMKFDTEEQIACKSKNGLFNPVHAANPLRGDGWSGLTEVDFFTTALGLENERGSSLIASQAKVNQCIQESDPLMQNQQATNWVADAVKRNSDWADKAGEGSGAPADKGKISAQVQEDIDKVRPSGENAKLRLSDSMANEGLTVTTNVAVMEEAERRALARHFCFRPEQFLKLMNPAYDPLQLEGGADWRSLITPSFLWANYCPKGVTLMTNPELSRITNIHQTPTDFVKGMEAWSRDPLYCQRLQSTQNANLGNLGFDRVIEATNGASGGARSAQELGYTCLEGGKLNLGMVPVTFMRNSAVERRTAIADKLFGFLIAGTLSTQANVLMANTTPLKSYFKGFEPRPYSSLGPQQPSPGFKTFIGKQFAGGGTNELGDLCLPINGNNFQRMNRSDQLYLSDFTHRPFTQQILVNPNPNGGGSSDPLAGAFNKYVQEWAKGDIDSQKMIAKREIARDGSDKSINSADKNVHTYASASRIVALCPAGHTRWRPPADPHNSGLVANLARHCQRENFGSPREHTPKEGP